MIHLGSNVALSMYETEETRGTWFVRDSAKGVLLSLFKLERHYSVG